METTDAVADTTQALRSALEAARRERDALTERLATVDQLIADLDSAVSGGATAPAGKRAGRKAAGKRAGRKTSAKRATRKSAAKRRGKKATSKASTRKRTARKRQGPGRTDRVVEIVSSAGQPLTTGDVRARLQQEEPKVSSKLVSAALTYAQRKGRIGKTDDGRWSAAG